MSRFGHLEFESEFNDSLKDNSRAIKGEDYYHSAAVNAMQAGAFETALRSYGKILEYNAQNTAAWSGQVRMLIELEEYREANLWADKALEKFPHDAELLAAKAVALARSGDLEGALAFSDASIAERGDLPYVWLARADVLLARKERRADYCFERAALISSKDWIVLWLSARIRSFYKQFSRALKLLQEAIELNPSHFFLWLEIGHCQEVLGLREPARFSYQQALELNPGCAARECIVRMAKGGPGLWFRSWYRRFFGT